MVQKIVCGLLVVCIIFSTAGIESAKGERSVFYYEPSITNTINYTINEWVSNSNTRATLATSLLLDLASASEDSNFLGEIKIWDIIIRPVYIMKGDDSLFITLWIDDTAYAIIYAPGSSYVAFTVIAKVEGANDFTDEEIEIIMGFSIASNFSEYYSVPTSDILNVLLALGDIISNPDK